MTTTPTTIPTPAAQACLAGEVLTRREALGRGVSATSAGLAALAFASVPVALAAFSSTLLAQAPTTVLGALEFAYLLENLESEFYKAILGESQTAAQNAAFAPVRAQLQTEPIVMASLRQIARQEAAHVAFLRAQITAHGGSPVMYGGASFDFTGGNGAAVPGPFAAARTDLPTMLALAQLLEDTGVRAYKGQLENLATDDAALTAAMKIHSVEGRHAARIRRLRNVTGLKPWITSSTSSTTTGITATGGVSAATASIAATAAGFTRASGSFSTEGFAVGQDVTASGFSNAANNGLSTVTAVLPAATTGPAAASAIAATSTGYARAEGSFIANGFAVGHEITASGFTDPANNGVARVTAVTETRLTVSKAVPTVQELAAPGRTITAPATLLVTRAAPGVIEAGATGRLLLSTRGMAPGGTTLVSRAYTRETNTVHRGVDMAGLGSNTGGVGGVTEAFDEPLPHADVIFVIQNFVIGSTP